MAICNGVFSPDWFGVRSKTGNLILITGTASRTKCKAVLGIPPPASPYVCGFPLAFLGCWGAAQGLVFRVFPRFRGVNANSTTVESRRGPLARLWSKTKRDSDSIVAEVS